MAGDEKEGSHGGETRREGKGEVKERKRGEEKHVWRATAGPHSLIGARCPAFAVSGFKNRVSRWSASE